MPFAKRPLIARVFCFVLAAAVAVTGPLGRILAAAQQTEYAPPKPTITEWPSNLRVDLRGESVRIIFAENIVDPPWNDALLAKFTELTGITATREPGDVDTSVLLARYLRQLRSGSSDIDVYDIDVVWPGMLAQYAEDLRPTFGNLPDFFPAIVENNSVNGKLVAVPYFSEVSLLYYRKDLLDRYGFAKPPATWAELERQARAIQAGERTAGKQSFWGFLWQGGPSEALTCNALEWQASSGGGVIVEPNGAVSINNPHAIAAFERSKSWIGTISPPEVTRQLEDDSLGLWVAGAAAFMRNWPYAYLEGNSSRSAIRDKFDVTIMPRGDAREDRSADALGGFQLMINKNSRHKGAAVELIRYLSSREIQQLNAKERGYAPTRPAVYDDPAVLASNPYYRALRQIFFGGAVARPSTASGAAYNDISIAYYSAVHQVLTGEKGASQAVRELEEKVKTLLQKSASR